MENIDQAKNFQTAPPGAATDHKTSSDKAAEDRRLWSPPPPMTAEEFEILGGFIQSEFGIKMPPTKKIMLQSRLTKRLRAMHMTSYREYRKYLFSEEGLKNELPFMIDVVTTNKTDFFRERPHFDFLFETILPEWMQQTEGRASFRVWSAGCSSGEEPYSLAMILKEFALINTSFKFEVLGTDISGEVLDKARQAVYPEKKTVDIPDNLKKKYLLRSKDRKKQLTRIAPEIRARVSFRRLNLMSSFSCPEKKDAIFCRNVIIYFERPVQEALFRKCCDCLKMDGYLFIGHSETLNGMDLPLKMIRPTIYQKI